MEGNSAAELWLDNPLVQFAITTAGEDAAALDVMEILLTMLHELEELAPGVPFAQILAGVSPGRQFEDVRACQVALTAAGVSDEDIEAIMGLPKMLTSDTVVPKYEYHEIVALAQGGMPVTELVELTGFGRRRIYRILQANGVERDQRRKGNRPEDHGYPRGHKSRGKAIIGTHRSVA